MRRSYIFNQLKNNFFSNRVISFPLTQHNLYSFSIHTLLLTTKIVWNYRKLANFKYSSISACLQYAKGLWPYTYLFEFYILTAQFKFFCNRTYLKTKCPWYHCSRVHRQLCYSPANQTHIIKYLLSTFNKDYKWFFSKGLCLQRLNKYLFQQFCILHLFFGSIQVKYA